MTGKYYGDVMTVKKVTKSTEIIKVFEELLLWLKKISQKKTSCRKEYSEFKMIYGEYVNATKCAMTMRQLLVQGANGNISELNHDWLLSIPNFREFYERENGLPEDGKYLNKVIELLEKLILPSIMLASSFGLKQSCGIVGPVKQGLEELEI